MKVTKPVKGRKKIWVQMMIDVSWESEEGKKDLLDHLKQLNSKSIYAGGFRIQNTKRVKLPKF